MEALQQATNPVPPSPSFVDAPDSSASTASATLSNATAPSSATTMTSTTPSYVSSRSANSLISFSRPTRIQAITLEFLNKTLDELLLLIISSAKSLATDRIKSEGILRVLGGQMGSGSGAGALLAKNAVLEAELELRSYLDGQRKEGGKMPLGLSSSSRLDGTDAFPVQSAYKILRIRCQYYSTLGDMEDPSPRQQQDQNIMSSDGRPLATITPGVAIYVTALLEFVAEYVLQNVARVIERDNSDEASLNDLIKAIEEDEGTSYVWKKMRVKREIEQEVQINGRGTKVQKPWQVPHADEFDLAAGAKKKFNRQSVTTASAASDARGSEGDSGPTMSASHSTDNNATSGPVPTTNGPSSVGHGRGHVASPSNAGSIPALRRRPSTDRAWFLGKRRGSFRSSQDLSGAMLAQSDRVPGGSSAVLTPNDVNASATALSADHAGQEGGDFDSLVMSGQTMKVSLTPNRLRSMDNTAAQGEKSDDVRRTARKRPGTGNLALRPPTTQSDTQASSDDRATGDDRRPASRNTIGRKNPPSAYRAVDSAPDAPSGRASENGHAGVRDVSGDGDLHNRNNIDASMSKSGSSSTLTTQREDKRKSLSVRDMVNMINNSSPPSPGTIDESFATSGRESRMSLASQASTTTDVGAKRFSTKGKMLNLFGRKSSISSITAPSPNPSTHTTSSFKNSETHQRPPLSSAFSNGSGGAGSVHDDLVALGSPTHERIAEVAETKYDRQSRSPELVLSAPEESRRGSETLVQSNGTIDESVDEQHTSNNAPAVVGIYQEPRANASNSTLSSSTNQVPRSSDTSASRKVPWSYSRQQSLNGRRYSGPMISRADASSSQGHGEASGGAPPSAWSQNNLATEQSSTEQGSNNRSSVHGVSPTFGGRTSPSLRPFGSSSKSTDTARLLVQLNQRMRECNSVDECQRLVTQALAFAATAVHSEHGSASGSTSAIKKPVSPNISPSSSSNDVTHKKVGEIPDEAGSQSRTQEDLPVFRQVNELAAPESISHAYANDVSAVPLVRPIVYRNLTLPMAVGYDASEDDNLPAFRRQSVVAAWLLDSEAEEPVLEDEPELQELKKEKDLPVQEAQMLQTKATRPPRSRQTSASSAGHDSDFLSADERPRATATATAAAAAAVANPTTKADAKAEIGSMASTATDVAPSSNEGTVQHDPLSNGMDATDALLKQRRLAYTNSRNAAKQSIMRSGSRTTTPPANASASSSPQRVPYQLPAAATPTNPASSIAPGFVEDEEGGKRISTVSSTYSAYRDAEEGTPPPIEGVH